MEINLPETIEDCGYNWKEGDTPFDIADGWNVVKITDNEVTLSRTTGKPLSITLRQLKPFPGDLPFRVIVTTAEESNNIFESDYAHPAITTIENFIRGVELGTNYINDK